jgi:hypothetical protein
LCRRGEDGRGRHVPFHGNVNIRQDIERLVETGAAGGLQYPDIARLPGAVLAVDNRQPLFRDGKGLIGGKGVDVFGVFGEFEGNFLKRLSLLADTFVG